MTSLKVTFDTNTLDAVVTPDCGDWPDHRACLIIHQTLGSGLVKGYFAEAVLTLDALGGREKVEKIGDARLVSESHTGEPIGGQIPVINISIGMRTPRKSIHPRFAERIRAARALGMKALIGPRRLGEHLVVDGFGEDIYEPLTIEQISIHATKIPDIQKALAQHGVGRVRAVELGLQWSRRDGKAGEFWMQGIGRHRNESELTQAHEAINEWADGEAIGAHYGYGNHLFCTHDRARGSGVNSALHPNNRAWLSSLYGVEFVTVSDLAKRVEALA